MIIHKLLKQGAICPPAWLPDNVAYMTITGSMAYGVNNNASDQDLIGFVVPPKEYVFPHVEGLVRGFDRLPEFNVWDEKHKRLNGVPDKEYDFAIYGIVKFFSLVAENNPNMIGSLFTPINCVVHSTNVGDHVREHRRTFLHKGAWHKFKGYAFAQMNKIKSGSNSSNPIRQASIEEFGYDVKFAYHVVRLMNEIEQILIEGDLDVQRSREQLKAIRRGEWSLDQLVDYFNFKEKSLEQVYVDSKLRHRPDYDAVRTILLEALEMHYGSIDKLIARDTSKDMMIRELNEVIARHSK